MSIFEYKYHVVIIASSSFCLYFNIKERFYKTNYDKIGSGSEGDDTMNSSIRLAPVTHWNIGVPAIHGPDLTGASAGKPFLYTIPATGERPLKFTAEGLPEGLAINPDNGQITGCVKSEGQYRILLKARNRHGQAEKEFDIIIGSELALTPPMGWNSWNTWRRWVDDAKVRAAAEHMVDSGLAARGYTYINIDSCWQGERGGKHNAIEPNRKFPNMPALAEFIHNKGLKFGIYSSPWVCPWGCSKEEAFADWGGGSLIGCSAGERDPDYPNEYPQIEGKYVGKEKYEANDVAQWVDWDVDFLKYDWALGDMASLERIGRVIKNASRDIVLSLCTGMKIENIDAYKKWAHMWRGSEDTHDDWNNLLRTGLHSEEVNQRNWRPYIGPDNWYDLDMLALGPQFDTKESTTPCKLTLEEQITQMSYWALFPSPLMLSCNLANMDDFTLRLFGNEEILAVNQDRLGKPAVRVKEIRQQSLSSTKLLHDNRVHARQLSDGTLAVGFFNLSDHEDEVSIPLSELELRGTVAVRNLWERKDLGDMEDKITLSVPSHGSQIVKVTCKR
jgi:alpha-galactosidase